jgi:hypothetical protein
MLAVVGSFFALGVLVAARDAYKSRTRSAVASPAEDCLLEASAASIAAAAEGRSSLRLAVPAFFAWYSGPTSSAYVVMPCTLVFVLNARPSAFARAGSCDRAMIVLLPVMALLLRALVIRRRVVQLTSADQKLLYVSSACSCLISGALGASFAAAADARQSALSLSQPRCLSTLFALLLAHIVAQTGVRLTATRASVFHNTDWPSLAASHASSAVFSLHQLVPRLVTELHQQRFVSRGDRRREVCPVCCRHLADGHGHRWPRVCVRKLRR